MIAILIAAACALQVNPVDDFFPLAEGTRWTYEDVKSREVWVQEAGAPIDVSGQLATPISARVDGVRGDDVLPHERRHGVYRRVRLEADKGRSKARAQSSHSAHTDIPSRHEAPEVDRHPDDPV